MAENNETAEQEAASAAGGRVDTLVMRECNACTWSGNELETLNLGGVKNLCPYCRETTFVTAGIDKVMLYSQQFESFYRKSGRDIEPGTFARNSCGFYRKKTVYKEYQWFCHGYREAIEGIHGA